MANKRERMAKLPVDNGLNLKRNELKITDGHKPFMARYGRICSTKQACPSPLEKQT